MKVISVAAAIIQKDGRYLITQRPPSSRHFPLKWEFPGGKMESYDRTLEICLKREIQEELDLEIVILGFFGRSDYYDLVQHIILRGFTCRVLSGEIKSGVVYRWVNLTEMGEYDFCPADIKFVKKLQRNKEVSSARI